jgi:hypothetical protein
MTQQTVTRPDRASTPTRLIPIAITALVAVIAAVALWFVFAGDSTPSVTFDGQTVTYDGPTTFDAGDVTFTFDASEYEPGVRFAFIAINDDTLTASDLEAELDGAVIAAPEPEFFDTENTIPTLVTVQGDTADERVEERSIRLEADTRYVLVANTFSTDTNTGHWGALIEVN